MDTHDKKNDSTSLFPPVVTVLGHVDHGKTTLLDAIRKTSHVKREVGGITQKIGASAVVIPHEKKLRKITFLDTPGHEAFGNMRSRGATVADIGLLIISSADGVMPQTKESIALLKQSEIPFIVVLTKTDLDTSNSERVKQQLLKEQVMLENYGGEIPVIEVSAKTNHNIQALLDLILLIFDLRESSRTVSSTDPFSAVIIESRRDPKVGPRASIVVKSGTLNARDEITCEGVVGKVKSMITDSGEMVKSATVGDAVELLGFDDVPAVGGVVTLKSNPKTVVKAVPVAQLQKELVYQKAEKQSDLALVLVADSEGSLEAILQSLPKEVKILAKKTGEVSENDILMAKSTGGLVLSFNSRIKPDVARFAMLEKVLAKNYEIIYEMLDEIKDVLEGKKLAGLEQILGRAKVLALFPFDKQTVLGVSILEGRLAKGDLVRLERGDVIVGESTIASVRSGKNQISKVERGHEAGILLSHVLDFRVGDMIVSHT
ncbi:MAG: hypothetical protein RLZZ455_307 [Candidatus Parcubacteria bacterium]|jgi:translation initiation factor IF-2